METISRAEAKTLGLKRFFTGEPCGRGHVAPRRVNGGACVECAKLGAARAKARCPDYHANYRAKNRDKARAFNKDYYAKRADEMRDYAREYRRKNADSVREKDRLRRQSEAELRRTRERDRYKAEGERIREREKKRYQREHRQIKQRVSKYRAKYPDRVREVRRVGVNAARARKRNAPGKFTKSDVKRLFIEQNGICNGCRIDLSADYHVDHMVPLSRSGTNWPDNLQLLCEPCNLSKNAKTMEEWLTWRAEMATSLSPSVPDQDQSPAE